MMEKRITSSANAEILNKQSQERALFARGTKFFLSDKTWIVAEEFTESSTSMRRVLSNVGDEEVLTLATLKKDAESPGFMFMEPTENEKLAVMAMVPKKSG